MYLSMGYTFVNEYFAKFNYVKKSPDKILRAIRNKKKNFFSDLIKLKPSEYRKYKISKLLNGAQQAP